jgi:hypothetical protein
MSDDIRFAGLSIVTMTGSELRRAFALAGLRLNEEERRGITVEQIGPGKIDEAFRKATQP